MTKAIKQFTAAVLLSLFVLSPAVLVSAQKRGGQGAAAAPYFGNVEGVSAAQLKEYLSYIASDELEGRDTPSKGLDMAAKYIADHLKQWGIKPAGDDGTYFQKIPLVQSKVIPAGTKLDVAGEKLEYGKDFYSSLIPAEFSNAPVVFAGYGWVIKSKGIDPYKGIDVKDKVVVVVNSLPKGVTFGDLKGPAGGDWYSPPLYAQRNGAKAVIAFASFSNLANFESTRWAQSERGIPSFGVQDSQITIPTFTIGPRGLTGLFSKEKASASSLFAKAIRGEDLESFDLSAAKRVSGAVAVKKENVSTQNVVGILEGTDPELKKEYVAVGAHYDHVGTNPFIPGADKIWNGADDDGSGTVSVLSIAEAFAKGPQKPRRSMLFIWHAGEEKGLWGSEYFTSHPTVPITSVITELNVDMIGRYQNPGDENDAENKNLPKPGEVFTIGSRMMSTDLGNLADRVNQAYLGLKYNTKYDDPNDPEQFFYRSDHFNYAKHGVPIIFFMDGSHRDYHQVSDSIEKINFEQMERVARTILALGACE